MKKFFAIQHGDDYAQDWGSEIYSEAVKMAEDACEDYPGEEIRIVTCTPDDCGAWTVDTEEIIREGSR